MWTWAKKGWEWFAFKWGKCVILSSAMASKCPLKLLLPLVILKDSNMTLEVDTREKGLDTGSHSLQHRYTTLKKKLNVIRKEAFWNACSCNYVEKQAQRDELSTGSWRLTCAECALSWATERHTRSGRHSHSRWAQWGMRWQSDGLESRGQPWVLRGNSHRPMTRRHLKGPLPQEGWHIAYLHTPSLEGEEKKKLMDT